MAITIHSLEVRFDVKGSDEQRFAELFARAIRGWAQEDAERRRASCRAMHERSLGGRAADEEPT